MSEHPTETPSEKNRRERRGSALTALQHLLAVALVPYKGDRPSEEDLNAAFRRVNTCISEFEGEANDLERASSLAPVAPDLHQHPIWLLTVRIDESLAAIRKVGDVETPRKFAASAAWLTAEIRGHLAKEAARDRVAPPSGAQNAELEYQKHGPDCAGWQANCLDLRLCNCGASPLPPATEPEAIMDALLQTGVASVVTTDMIDGHDWVCSPLDTSILWCQWCGRHRVEVSDWIDHPQCPAFAKVRAVLEARASSPPPEWQPIETAPEAEWVSVYLPGMYAVTAMRTTSRGTPAWFLAGPYDGPGVRLNPSHWQHLPVPPSASGPSKDQS
jgi:hypothetical protein